MAGTLTWSRTPAVADAIVERFEQGEMMTVIMRDYGESHARWYEWCEDDAALAQRFRKAKAAHHRAIAEGALEIVEAEPSMTNVLDKERKTVISTRVDHGYVAWQKLRYDARMRSLAKWDAEHYGDSSSLDLRGGLASAVEVGTPAELTKAIAERLRANKRDAELLAAAEEFL